MKVWLLAVWRYSTAKAAIRRGARACVVIQTLYRERGAATQRYSARVHAATRSGVRYDTAGCALRHDRPGLQHGRLCLRHERERGHDTVSCAPRYSLARATTRRRARGLDAVGAQARQGVHLVHPTSFRLNALFLSHCLGHCSQDFSKKKSNQIK